MTTENPKWDGLPHWEQEPEVAEDYIRYLDESVEKALPEGTVFQEILPHGASFWTRTAKIEALDADEEPVAYFLKVSIDDTGKGMMHGEFESMTALHGAMPELAPKPLSWGTYESDPNIHFFLCEFVDMDDGQLCSLDTFPKLMAKLHRKAVSPSGKFGFHVTTYQGRLPQDPTPCDTWEECFRRNIHIMFEHELASQGYEEEFAQLREAVMSKVLPRLLRPMETGGRKVVPTLVHGDLWEGNTGTDLETGIPKIFDACSLYAHNEYEMAPWRPVRQKMGKPYVVAYNKCFPISEPVEDFDGRNMLYALRFNICSSALYPGNPNYRNLVRAEMRELIERYGEGFKGWLARHPEPRTDL
ncbi:Fructosamine kinase-domain-containing protein [Podospora australis]|uniref:protein-ribulosamine 3-kinase n=1 Tax=Podospora australis TaxID=1536484 RepID=A0AAN7AD06_9PEZI|nr:Fructosamine kinase-domain-containing protein [Podospora australis]